MTDDLRFPTADSPDSRACAAVDERLMDYLEGDLPAGDRLVLEGHLAGCARCRTLVADLRAIAGEAAALPVLRPERDLWAGIARRSEAPVVALPSRPAADPAAPSVHVTRTDRRAAPGDRATIAVSRRWLAAAAAALVAATAGATYVATKGSPAADRRIAVASEPRTGTAVPALPAGTPTPAPSDDAQPTDSTDATPPAPARVAPTRVAPARIAPAAPPTARLAARRSAPGASVDVAVPGAVAYDRAIAAMRNAVGERRSELDSGTVEVLERNLRIIDEAIRQSREALARDPKSQFLGRALTSALDRKLELLRTAAMLPRS